MGRGAIFANYDDARVGDQLNDVRFGTCVTRESLNLNACFEAHRLLLLCYLALFRVCPFCEVQYNGIDLVPF